MSHLPAIDWSEPVTLQCILVILQTTLVAAGGLLAARLFRRDASTRHAVLLATLVALAGGPFVVLGLHKSNWSLLEIASPDRNRPAPATIPSDSALPLPNSLTENGSEASQPALSPNGLSGKIVSTSIEPTTNPVDDATVAPLTKAHTTPASGPTIPTIGLAGVAALVWLAGSLLVLLRVFHGTWQVYKFCGSAQPANEPQVTKAVAAVESLSRRRVSWQLLKSDRVSTAFATGLFRPTIVVPKQYVDALTSDELSLVLTHEAAHLFRRDFVVAVIQRLAAMIYWPHPLLHALNRRLAQAREEACDNFVLQHHDPADYARLLLRLKELNPAQTHVAGALAFMDGRWSLEDRVAGMLDAQRERATYAKRRALVPVTAVLLAVGVVLAGIRVSDHAAPVGEAQAGAIDTDVDAAPLPAGSVTRLGDNRLRHYGWHKNVGFSADGSVMVSSSESSLRFWDASTGEFQREVPFGSYQGLQMRLTPDRNRIAVLSQEFDVAAGTVNHEIRFWDMEGNRTDTQLTWPQDVDGPPRHVTFTPDSQFALIGDATGHVTIQEVASGDSLLRYRIADRGITGLAVSPDGRLVAIATESNSLFLWDWQTGAEPSVVNKGRRWLGVAFSPDGQQLAASPDSRHDVQLYDVATRTLIRSFVGDQESPILAEGLAFTPDGKQLAAANAVRLSDRFVGAVLVWDVESGELVRRLSAPGVHPRAMSISADGRKLAAADWDTSVQIWDLETGTALATGTGGHNGVIRSVNFGPSSRRILTAAEDHTARLWDAATGAEVARLPQEQGTQTAALSPDGTLAVTGGMNDTVILWELPAGKKRHEWKGERNLGGASALRFTSDGHEVVALMDDLRIRRWRTDTGEQLDAKLLRPTDLGIEPMGVPHPTVEKAFVAAFDREEVMDFVDTKTVTEDAAHVVLTGRRKQQYWVFDAATGKEVAQRELPFRPSEVCVSPDGLRIAIGGRGRSKQSENNPGMSYTEESSDLTVVDFESGDTLWSIAVAATSCGAPKFSADGRWLALIPRGREKSNVRIYNAATGDEVHLIEATSPLGWRNSLAFSPDGKSFAVAQTDSTVLVWKLEMFGPPFAR